MKSTTITLTSLLVVSALLSGCSFSKDPDKNKVTAAAGANTATDVFEATRLGDVETVETYLAKMSVEQINTANEQGQTLLEVAIRLNNVMIVEKLLARGAMPLKPQYKSDLTIYDLAKKISPAMEVLLSEKIEQQKMMLFNLLKNRAYAEALQNYESFYMKLGEKIYEGGGFLEVLIANQTALYPDSSAALAKLIPVSDLKDTAQKLIPLIGGDVALLEVALSRLKEQGLVLDGALFMSSFRAVSYTQTETLLALLIANDIRLGQELSILQEISFSKFVAETVPGQLVDLEKLGRTLKALTSHAATGQLCQTCVNSALNEEKLQGQKVDIIKLILINSKEAPQGFLKNLLGRVALSDFRKILESMSQTQKAGQQDVMDYGFDVEEFELLSSQGFRLSPQQARAQILSLFAERHSGENSAEVNGLIRAIRRDLAAARNQLSNEELNDLFAAEISYVYGQGLAGEDFVDILGLVAHTELKGMVSGRLGSDEIFVNPLYFKSTSGKTISPRLVNTLNQKILSLAPGLAEDWILKVGKNTLSEREYIWSTVVSPDQVMKVAPVDTRATPISDALARLSLTVIGELNNDQVIALLKSLDAEFSSPDQKYVNKYMSALLRSEPNELRFKVLEKILTNISAEFNFGPRLKADFDFFFSRLKVDDLEVVFQKIYLPYLLKIDRRLAFALNGFEADYVAFLGGDFSRDPLCARENSNLFREHCDRLAVHLPILEGKVIPCGSDKALNPETGICHSQGVSVDNIVGRGSSANLLKYRNNLAHSYLSYELETLRDLRALKVISNRSRVVADFLAKIQPVLAAKVFEDYQAQQRLPKPNIFLQKVPGT